MKINGRGHKFGDDINTDYIIAAKRKAQTTNLNDLVPYIMEDISPGFYDRMETGDLIIGGENFGCGSSREHAPYLLKEAGISAVVAKSFARIFFRNAINIGLPVIVCDTDQFKDGDIIEVDLEKGYVADITRQINFKVNPLPRIMRDILFQGGLIPYLDKNRDFKV